MPFGRAKDDKKEKRFVEVSSEGVAPVKQVIVDNQTGVNYLMVYFTYGVAVTPLLNPDGSPIVTPVAGA